MASPITWTVHEVQEAVSTNDLARSHAPWSLVRCHVQTGGRGRFNREWIGQEGGLWVSYNVPLAEESTSDWRLLPLVAGIALLDALKPHRVPDARLRWPNDLMVGRKKLAGILVERPSATMATIGIGVNMLNSMADLAGKTKDAPARMVDYAAPCPAVDEFAMQLAQAIQTDFLAFVQNGMQALMPKLEQAWGKPRTVEVQTDQANYTGTFIGITPDGSPILRRKEGDLRAIPGHTVNRLIEL